MQWEFDWLHGPRVARARTTGTLVFEGILAMVGEGMAFAQRHGARRLLVDHSASSPGATLAEVYRLPDEAEARGLTRDFRLAIVPPNDGRASADFAFYEDRAQNTGFRHRVFRTVDDAMTWLIHEPEANGTDPAPE